MTTPERTSNCRARLLLYPLLQRSLPVETFFAGCQAIHYLVAMSGGLVLRRSMDGERRSNLGGGRG